MVLWLQQTISLLRSIILVPGTGPYRLRKSILRSFDLAKKRSKLCENNVFSLAKNPSKGFRSWRNACNIKQHRCKRNGTEKTGPQWKHQTCRPPSAVLISIINEHTITECSTFKTQNCCMSNRSAVDKNTVFKRENVGFSMKITFLR